MSAEKKVRDRRGETLITVLIRVHDCNYYTLSHTLYLIKRVVVFWCSEKELRLFRVGSPNDSSFLFTKMSLDIVWHSGNIYPTDTG